MINSYTGDLIDIITTSIDENGGITGSSTQEDVACYIEDYNKLIRDKNGREVMGDTIIFLEPEVVITENSRIKLVKKAGEDMEKPTKEFTIKRLSKIHSFVPTHWEVII